VFWGGLESAMSNGYEKKETHCGTVIMIVFENLLNSLGNVWKHTSVLRQSSSSGPRSHPDLKDLLPNAIPKGHMCSGITRSGSYFVLRRERSGG